MPNNLISSALTTPPHWLRGKIAGKEEDAYE